MHEFLLVVEEKSLVECFSEERSRETIGQTLWAILVYFFYKF